MQKDYPKGALRFAPLTHLNKIEEKSSDHGVAVKMTNVVAYCSSPAKPTPDNYKKGFLEIPFWWVGSVTDEAKANMHLCTLNIGDLKVPVLQNTSKVQKNAPLLLHKPAKEKRALEGADIQSAPLMRKPRK